MKLLYENMTAVQDQSKLKDRTNDLGESFRIGRDGKGHAQIRFNDVSKNHQKQKFVVCIMPDTEEKVENSDIAPCVTRPVLVKSKVRKKVNSGGTKKKGGTSGETKRKRQAAASSSLYSRGGGMF